MNKRYTNLNNLISDVKSDIDKSLKNEVFDEVRNIELEHVQKDVLDAYSPRDYVSWISSLMWICQRRYPPEV